jgi:parallel beta-helix repeat protein
MIMNNNISRVEVGIDISEAANVTIADHTISSLNYAFILHSVKNATIENNFLFNNTGGATIYASSSLRIIGNEVSYNNRVGIGLYFSTLATIKGNTFNNNGIHMRGSAVEQYNSHTISLDNLVNSLPIRYHKDCSSLVVDNIPLGQLIVGNCTDVLATNLTATNTDSGIQMGFVDGATILSNNASSNNIDGIAIRSGTDLTVVNNSVFSNNGVGINLEDLSNVIVSENNICCSGGTGVYIMSASGAKVSLNNLSSNDQGVYIGYSESSAIVTNDVFDNDCGVNLGSSSNITVMDNDIVHGWDGMYVYDSTNSTIDNNVISYNGRRGIHFLYSSYNTISSNIISYSGETGIYLFSTVGTRPGNNTIYHNSIVNNTLQAFDNTHLNQWDDGYPSGGNYWSDYAGVDLKSGPNQDLPGSDSIGDTPYEIDFDSEDRYPLMSPTRIPRVRPPALLSSTLNGINFENVMITWSLSPDDGREFKSVIGYNIHRGTTYDTMGAGYGLITSLPNGTTEFSDDLAGEGDPNNYFYQVCALDLHNDTSCSPAQAGKFTCQLSKGPNLLSVPLIQSDYSVEAVLQTIKWEKAWIYDSYDGKWKWNVRFKPYVGEFHKLNLSSGIWVDVNDNSNFTVGGIVPSQTSILLCRGWNLVGYPSFSVQLVSEALLGVSYKVVEGFEPAMPPYYLRELSSSDPMSAGEGYWIELSGDSVWIVRN